MPRFPAMAAGLALAFSSAAVQAQTATTTFLVSLTIEADCAITADPLNFGTASLLDTAVNATTTLGVTCTESTPYNVGLDAGTAAGSTIADRLLAGTGAGNTGTTVAYQLYQDEGRTTIWGNTEGTDTVGGVGSGAAQTLTVYGQVPAQAAPVPDTYQSTVTATVYF